MFRVSGFLAMVLTSMAMPYGTSASGLDEGTHHLSNVDIHYIEALPNSSEGDELQDRMRRVYKQLDEAGA
jgi:hypothetical protein